MGGLLWATVTPTGNSISTRMSRMQGFTPSVRKSCTTRQIKPVEGTLHVASGPIQTMTVLSPVGALSTMRQSSGWMALLTFTIFTEKGAERVQTQEFRLLQERHKQLHARSPGGVLGTTPISPIFPTCLDNFNAAYLNRADVQAVLGVDPSTIPNGKWASCGLDGNYSFNYHSELPNYKQWVADGKLRMLIYNGDADFILTHMGNSAWIREGLELK